MPFNIPGITDWPSCLSRVVPNGYKKLYTFSLELLEAAALYASKLYQSVWRWTASWFHVPVSPPPLPPPAPSPLNPDSKEVDPSVSASRSTSKSPRASPLDECVSEWLARYETILSDLPKHLSSSETSQMLSDIKAYLEQHRDDANSIVLEIQKTLGYLRGFGESFLFSASQFSINEHDIIQVPADGNCLYHTFLIVAQTVSVQFGEIRTHQDLRQAVAKWLEEHQQDSQCAGWLFESIATYLGNERGSLDQQIESLQWLVHDDSEPITAEQKAGIQRSLADLQAKKQAVPESLDAPAFINLVRQEGFFGHYAEIYALSQMFDVTIRIQQRNQATGELVCEDVFPAVQGGTRGVEVVLHAAHYNARVGRADS